MNAPDCSAQIAALRHSGAQRLDPVRFHYLELLAVRAQGQPPKVRQVLEARLALALAAWPLPGEAAAETAAPAPVPSSLQGLLHYLAQQAPDGLDYAQADPAAAAVRAQSAGGTPTELRSVREFRSTWSRLSADRQLAQALKQAPKNAGPINSHMLVLRSLSLMREIAPGYLNYFMTYADTLLCLEQSERVQHTAARAEAHAGNTRKPRARRIS